MAFGAKVKLSVNKTGARNFRNEIQKFVDDSTASNPIRVKNIKLELNKSQQTQLRRNIQDYLNASGDNLTIKINKIDASGAVKQLRSQLETMLSGLSITGLKDFLGTEGIGSTYERAAVAADKLATAQENVRRKSEEVNASVRVLKTLQNNANSAYIHGNKITDAEQVTKITNDYQVLCTQIEKTKNLEGEEQQIAIQGIVEKTAALRAYIDEIYENQAASKRAAAEEEKNNQVVIASLQKVNTLYKRLSTYAKNNPRVMSDGLMGGQINGWMSQLASGTQFTEDELRSMENGFAAIAMRAREAGLEGKTFGDRIFAAYKKFGGWTLVTRTLTLAIQKFKQMISIVTQLDTAMTELRKVTNLTDKAYDELFDRAIVRAKKLGATVTDIITATADFARLGYGAEEAEKLADAAIVYKNVGDGIEDITTASESIISTLKAFGNETLSAMEIVDKFNEVGNNFAISSKGVGDALMRSSAALAAAGNTIDESIALAVGMNSVIQDPEKVGTVLKTASMYLRAAKTEAEDAGESTEGMANSVSELRKELLKLTKGKVDIMADDTTFKSTIQIYRELAGVWKDLEDIDAANILELIGGKRNATANASLLANFEDAEAALVTSANAAGSALKENEKFLASIQGRLDVFKATFEEFSASFIDGDLVNFVLSIGTVLLNLLTALDKLHLLLPAITMSITLLAARKKALQLQESVSMVNTLASAITKEKAVTDTLSTSVAFLTTKEKALLISKIEEAATSGLITAEQKAQILSTLGLATAEGTLTIANKGLAASFKSLMASIPVWGWIALGVSAVIEVVMPLIDMINQSKKSIEDLNTEWEELSNTIQNTANSFQQTKKDADDIIPKYAKLAQGVDRYGKNISLTDEEFSEFISLNNKLGEMFPELVQGYDANGNAILAISGNVDTLTNSLYECVKAQRLAAAQEIADTMPDVVENIKDTTDAYEDQIKKLEEKKEQLKDFYNHVTSGGKPQMITRQGDYYAGLTEGERSQFYDDLGVSRVKYESKTKTPTTNANKGKGYKVETKFKYTYDADTIQGNYETADMVIDKQIKAIEEKIAAKNKQLNPVVSAWFQTDFLYQDLDQTGQEIVTRLTNSVDFKAEGLNTADKIKEYISDYIINPIYDLDDESKKAFNNLLDIEEAATNGEIKAKDYADKILEIINKLNIDDKTKAIIKVAFDVDDVNGIPAKIAHVKDILNDEFDNLADGLTIDELEIAYTIVAAKGSMTFAQLKTEIESMQKKMMETPIDSWSDLATVFDTYTEKMAGLATIQEAIKNGFIISADAAREFAKTYPEILQYATAAGNGQIKLNADVVTNFLNGKTAELKGSIDTQITQLEAEKAVLEAKKSAAEAELELAKSVGEGEGQISAETAAYRIDCGNIIAKAMIANSIDEATAYQLAAAAMAGNVEEFNRIAAQVCTDVDGNFNQAAYDAAQTIYNNMHSAKISVSDFAKQCHEAAVAMAGVASGDVQGSTAIQGGGGKPTFGKGIKITLNNGNFRGMTFDYTPQEFALDEYIADLELNISEYTSKIAEIDGQIAVLKALKNKPIEQFHPDYGKDSGGSDKDKAKEVEEYIADVERYNEALQKLADVEREQAQIEHELENATDNGQRLELYKKLPDIYRRRQEALHELNNLRDTTIHGGVATLEALGFEIEYDDENNRLFIKNLEHLNELTADSAGEYDTLQEATNALRKETEELIDDITTLNEENQDASETWLELVKSTKEANRAIFDTRMAISENWLREREVLGWQDGDTEIKARQRILDWISSDYYKSLFDDEQEWKEIWLDNLEAYNNAVISAIDKAYDAYSDYIEDVNEGLENQKIKEQGLLDIKSKQYEATNRLTEAQHSADKAIADSRISKEYLSEREYNLIYNEEDYRNISNVIDDIDSDISRLTDNFNKQIRNAYANGQEYLIETITAEYERQVELKMQELTIAEAELDLVKKQTELQNVLAERNIRQMVEKDGKLQWEWVADVDKVRSVTEELADAEYEYKRAVEERNQQITIDRMQEKIDDFTDEQERNNKLVEQLGDSVDDVKRMIDDLENPIGDLTTDINTFKNKGVAGFAAAVDSMIRKMGSFAVSQTSQSSYNNSSYYNGLSGSGGGSGGSSRVTYDSSIDYMAQAQSAIKRGDDKAAANYLAKRDAKIDGEGLSYKKESLSDVKKKMGYASGTMNATKGWHEVDENGGETYITSDGKFHNFEGGEYVFDNEQTRRLWELSKKFSANISADKLSSIYNNLGIDDVSKVPAIKNTKTENSYAFGDIVIQNPANFDDFVKQLTNTVRKKTV